MLIGDHFEYRFSFSNLTGLVLVDDQIITPITPTIRASIILHTKPMNIYVVFLQVQEHF